MIDQILLVRKLSLISDELGRLEKVAQLSGAEYLENDVLQAASERYLERIIGRMIDINFHIITDNGDKPPKDYFGSFLELTRYKIMPKEFVEKIAHAAGLRNRIAHEYDGIDYAILHSAIQQAVIDIPVYMEYITAYIDKNAND